jgi:hypothetical protein
MDYMELSRYFSALAEEKGALYAYEVLRRGEFPPNTDTHLLGHVVGEKLYQESGASGMEHCTDEFRNACSHAIVVGLLVEQGEGSLSSMGDICRRAPGGRGAYTMCFHGLGHGIFAYTDYDLSKTIALCRTLGTAAHKGREYGQCFGGVVMELIGGGDHDKARWQQARSIYLDTKDPLAPCNRAVTPPELKSICYLYLTPHLYSFDGGNLAHPTTEDFRNAFSNAFSYCELVEGKQEKDSCFAGLGKEFPSLAQSRDIRRIEDISVEKLKQVYAWCDLAGHTEGREACLRSVVQSLFWGGENDPRAAISFCEVAVGAEDRDACMGELLGAARNYIPLEARPSFCPRFSGVENQALCKESLSS